MQVSTALAAVLALTAAAGFAIRKAPPASTTAPVAAQDATKPAAQDILAKMSAKYKGLTSYSGDGTLTQKRDGKTVEVANKVAFKNGKAAVKITTPEESLACIFDGKTLFISSSSEPKKYAKQSVETPAAGIQAAFSQADIGLLPILLMDPNAKDKVLLPNSEPPVLEPIGSNLDGVAVDVIHANLKNGQGTFRFEIGKDDSLLRRITITQKKDGKEISSISSTYRNIKLNPTLEDAQFAFNPAPGQVAEEMPDEQQMFDPRLKVGANPLPFAGTDTTGKPINLAQYKGKVVLIDFWATWCVPCVAEMPNVRAVYGSYKAKGFDVIGVSLDREGDKPKLVAFAKENKMPWRQIFDSAEGTPKLAAAYGVDAIPFTLLIGKDGKIAGVNLRGPELEPAVKAALAAK